MAQTLDPKPQNPQNPEPKLPLNPKPQSLGKMIPREPGILKGLLRDARGYIFKVEGFGFRGLGF